jgi:hypothetical protein
LKASALLTAEISHIVGITSHADAVHIHIHL